MSVPAVSRAVLSLALVGVGCVRHLPPAAIPAAQPPALAAAPPPEGQARLIVDVTDGPTPIDRVAIEAQARSDGASVDLVEVTRPACAATPCTIDLRPGNVILSFPVIGRPGWTETELVHVGPEPTVYRRTLSAYREGRHGTAWVLGVIAASVGGVSIATGAALLPIGLAKGSDGLTLAGALTLGGGGLLVGGGVWALRGDPDTFRPGAANHFDL